MLYITLLPTCSTTRVRSTEKSVPEMSEVPYLNKEDEVFERRVEVGLLLQLHDRVKVLVVDVSVDSEQPLQDGLRHRHKVPLEGDALGARRRTLLFKHTAKDKP